MNEFHIHDAIGEISEDLIAPVARLRQKKRYPVLKWAAVAACMCLLLSLRLIPGGMNSAKAESAVDNMQMGPCEENYSYGTADSASLPVFRAKVLEVYNENAILVEPLEGEDELKSSDRIEVSFWKLQQIPPIAVGDIVEIIYDGLIQEIYPARITGTFGVKVIE